VFALRETRKIGNGNEIRYKNEVYIPKDPGYCLDSRTTVEVRETFSGEAYLCHKGKAVKLKKIERANKKEQDTRQERERAGQGAYKPAANHPWRGKFINKDQNTQNRVFVAAS
jgi:stalled ribosome alternative rescue factor ArfA